MKVLRGVLVLVLVVGAIACRGETRTAVQQLLYDLESAVDSKDSDRVAALLTADFRGQGGMTKAAVGGELRRYFFAYESLDVAIEGVETDGEPVSKVSMKVFLSGKAKDVGGLASLIPDASGYVFELVVRSESGGLQVAEATWKPLEPRNEE